MKKIKKGFTLVELLVVIAILAILATVGIVSYTSFVKDANQSADQTEMTEINRYIAAEKTKNSNIEFADAVEIVYSNGLDLVARDEGHVYVWNKTNKKIEYKEKTETLGSEYERMSIVTTVDEFNEAANDGGIIYLDGSLNANAVPTKVFEIKKDIVIVGDDTNMIVPATGVSASAQSVITYSDQENPLFLVTDNNVSITLCGLNLTGTESANSLVCTKANNTEINLYNCTLTGSTYAINIRNYKSPGNKYGTPISDNANDAVANVTLKNCKISALFSAVNFKHVKGSLTIENCTLEQSQTGNYALIANESNGAKIVVKDSKLTVASGADAYAAQYGACNSNASFVNCTTNGSYKIYYTNLDQSVEGAGQYASTGNKIVVDGTLLKSN